MTIDNREWMTSLPEKLKDYSIIHLAIPGSHNSMTYGITSKSRIAPDAEPSIRRLYRFFPFFVRRWSKNQSASVLEQLEMGIRYFDMRVAQEDGELYYAHALFAMEVLGPLKEITGFLDEHPGEVVIIDFQHFYGLTVEQHKVLHQRLIDIFGERLYTRTDGPLLYCTLNKCRSLGRQVILIYRRCPTKVPAEFWQSNIWPTPWPNVASIKKLETFLEQRLLTREPTTGFVSQCVVTPSGRFIALRFFSSLRKTAKRVDKKLEPWILSQSPGPFHRDGDKPKVNTFICDFVNLNDAQFCHWVISLNYKLEQEASNISNDDLERVDD